MHQIKMQHGELLSSKAVVKTQKNVIYTLLFVAFMLIFSMKGVFHIARNLRIKVARAQKVMTQKALAEAVGISRQTMNAIEQGEYNPTIRLCRAICRVLGKSLDDLFWEENSDEEE